MDVTSAQSAVLASSSEISSTKAQSKTSNKTSEKSFNDEMKTASKTEDSKEEVQKDVKETEKADSKKTSQKDSQKHPDKVEHQEADEVVPIESLNGNVNYTDFKYHNESQSLLSQNIQNLLNTKDLIGVINSASTIDYDSINMSDNDAIFFANLVKNTDMSMQSIANQLNGTLIENNRNVQKNIQVSSILMDKLAESMKTNKPFRIDFDKDVSVIIKVNKDGSLSANFIPGDKAVEQYLRNNIASLKQRFDEENLPYSELSYSNSGNKQQRRKKENDNE